MNFKYAVFDMDGTLIKSMDAWDFCERKTVGDMCSINLLNGNDSHFVYKSLKDLTERAYKASGVHLTIPEVLPPLYKLMQSYYDNGSIKCVDGAKEYLLFLKKNGIKTAIATATDFEMCKKCLADNQLLDAVDVFVSTSEVGKSKHYPDVYERAIELIGGTKEDTVVFEDAYYCLETLRNNGFKYAIVHDGERSSALTQEIVSDATYYIHSYKELLK